MRVGPVGGYFGCYQITVCRRNVEKLSTVITDRMVQHIYRVEGGLIRHMEIGS